LEIIKATLYQPKKVGPNEVWVLGLFFTPTFDLQRSLFVFTMTKNVKLAMQKPSNVKPVTKLWRTLTSFRILEVKIPEYTKLAKLVVVQVIGSIENDCCFHTLIFMKIKLRNRLTMHSELVIHMFSLEIVPFVLRFKIGKTIKCGMVQNLEA
jgi:hypothetical protein